MMFLDPRAHEVRLWLIADAPEEFRALARELLPGYRVWWVAQVPAALDRAGYDESFFRDALGLSFDGGDQVRRIVPEGANFVIYLAWSAERDPLHKA